MTEHREYEVTFPCRWAVVPCTCAVITGGHRVTSPNCELHAAPTARVMSETPLPAPKPLADIVANWRRTAAQLRRIADELTACADALAAMRPPDSPNQMRTR